MTVNQAILSRGVELINLHHFRYLEAQSRALRLTESHGEAFSCAQAKQDEAFGGLRGAVNELAAIVNAAISEVPVLPAFSVRKGAENKLNRLSRLFPMLWGSGS